MEGMLEAGSLSFQSLVDAPILSLPLWNALTICFPLYPLLLKIICSTCSSFEIKETLVVRILCIILYVCLSYKFGKLEDHLYFFKHYFPIPWWILCYHWHKCYWGVHGISHVYPSFVTNSNWFHPHTSSTILGSRGHFPQCAS